MRERTYKKELSFTIKILLWALGIAIVVRVIAVAGGELAHGGASNSSPAASAAAANLPAPSNINAHSYLVANIDTGEIYTKKNTSLVYPIASISKLMTALVANDTMSMGQTFTMQPLTLELYGNKENFEYGEKLTMQQLFYFLLMESDNAVAETLSMSVTDPAFVKEMNAEAHTLGLGSMSFTDSTGLDAGDRGTAIDVFHLAQYISASEPFIWQITASPERVIKDSGYMHIIQSANLFSSDPRFVGGKVGYTSDADETMIALFKLTVPDPSDPTGKKTTIATIAFIVLDSTTRDADIGKLLGWFENNN